MRVVELPVWSPMMMGNIYHAHHPLHHITLMASEEYAEKVVMPEIHKWLIGDKLAQDLSRDSGFAVRFDKPV